MPIRIHYTPFKASVLDSHPYIPVYKCFFIDFFFMHIALHVAFSFLLFDDSFFPRFFDFAPTTYFLHNAMSL